jgi:hypothetical protein
MGTGHVVVVICWVSMVSRDRGDARVMMPEEERCEGIGLGKAIVAIVQRAQE